MNYKNPPTREEICKYFRIAVKKMEDDLISERMIAGMSRCWNPNYLSDTEKTQKYLCSGIISGDKLFMSKETYKEMLKW